MTLVQENKTHESVQDALLHVQNLLHKQQIVESLVHKQEMPKHDLVQSLVHKQHLAELQKLLDTLHPADVAYILEALPLDQRFLVWDLVKAERDGEILLLDKHLATNRAQRSLGVLPGTQPDSKRIS